MAAAWLAAGADQAALWRPGCCCGSRLPAGGILLLLLLQPPYTRWAGSQVQPAQSYFTSRLQRMFMAASSLTKYLKT